MSKSSKPREHYAAQVAITTILGLIIITLVAFLIVSLVTHQPLTGPFSSASTLTPLPAPELESGLRGTYGIDKNINETTIDNYLDRSDTVYRDLRMLSDTAAWENKGGNRMLTGFIRGFEVIPYPYLAGFSQTYRDQKASENVDGLYDGPTLFTLHDDGTYIPNYAESMEILKYIFPKDKNIILVCGAGGYAGITKEMLVALGWDASKIYNMGGYWYYEGDNNIPVENTTNGDTTYDFWKVLYHDIDFEKLHPLDS